MDKEPKVSILIVNYNNQKYIDECIKSLNCQSYKNFEIIFHDDSSKDNSVKVVQKYREVKIIKNKSRTKYGSFNQMKAYERAFKKSKGKIIFLLDSDDYFHKTKLKEIVNIFKRKSKVKAVYDLPIYKFGKNYLIKKNKKKLVKNLWPYIPPQSCISIRRNSFSKILKKVNFKKFPDIWMDFRFAIYLVYLSRNFFIYEKNLTYYRQSLNTESSKFKYLSIPWWKRRMQAHEYIKYFFTNNKVKYKKNIDFYLTKIINNFF